MTTDTVFAKLPDDLVLNILFKLEEDPRNWARMACVCTKFLSLVTDVCWKTKCSQTIPAVVSDLVAVAGGDPPGGWSALHKLAVCCPGLLHSGVLLENSDFGLERELGPDEKYQDQSFSQMGLSQSQAIPSSSGNNQDKSFSQMGQIKNQNQSQSIPSSSGNNEATQEEKYQDKSFSQMGQIKNQAIPSSSGKNEATQGEKYQDQSFSQMGQIKNQNKSLAIPSSSGNNQDKSFAQMGQSHNQAIPSSSGNNEATQECSWSLYDDLYYDTVYVTPELPEQQQEKQEQQQSEKSENGVVINSAESFSVCKRRKVMRPMRSHLASGVWNLCREQGNKLLASRFRGDCLYICDWPGCIHMEEKRNYMLFRGVFKDFKKSRVWRTINDGNRSKIDLNCAFCACKQTWDLHSAFCLRRVYGFHDDGEPVVRAYVCENGHVSGAWTDWPLYT